MANVTPSHPAPPAVPPATDWPQTGGRGLNSLGVHVDGWSDLIDGYGERAPAVANMFRFKIAARQHPRSSTQSATLTVGTISRQERAYDLITTSWGAVIAVYVSPFGRDMYLRWDLYVRQILNKRVVGAIAASALLFSTPLACGGIGLGALGESTGALLLGLTGWVLGVVVLFLLFTIPILVAGNYLRDDPLAYFFLEPSEFDLADIEATTKAVHRDLTETVRQAGIETELREKEKFFAEARRRRRGP